MVSGPSGSGKTTLLDVLLGWAKPDDGVLHFGEQGRPTERDHDGVGVVPQHLGLFEELTALENVTMLHRLGREGPDPEELLNALELDDLAQRLPRELSLGQQQRVAVARAVAASPSLLIADEPTSHQDVERAELVMSLLRSVAERGGAVLMTSHDPRVVSQCDRSLTLRNGRIVEETQIEIDPSATAAEPDEISPSGRRFWSKTRVRLVVAVLVVVAALVAFSLVSRTPSETTTVAQTPEDVAERARPETFGTVEEIQVASDALGESRRVLVFLPPGYDVAAEPLPTVYLLHGQSDTPEMFERIGLFRQASLLMASGQIETSIIVAPDLDNSFGVSNTTSETLEFDDGTTITYDGGDYEEFLSSELIEAIDTTYRTSLDPDDRSVGGISMGGFAALHLGLRHPELFGKVGAHSPALIGPEFTWLYPNDEIRSTRDPFILASETATAEISHLAFYLDVGEQDEFDIVEPVAALAAALSTKAPVESIVRPGNHSDEYWRQRVGEYLRFYAGQ